MFLKILENVQIATTMEFFCSEVTHLDTDRSFLTHGDQVNK